MPSLRERGRWLAFVDWNGDGSVSVSELSTAVAAMFPVDEDGVEQFLRETFSIEGTDFSREELEWRVLPYLENHAAELAAAAPSAPPPALEKASTRPELLAWFKHWDADGSGTLDAGELRFAIAAHFFRVLGDADTDTKQAVVEAFLAKEGLQGCEQITKSMFLDRLAPALQRNLPQPTPNPRVESDPGTILSLRLLHTTSGMSAEISLPATGSLGDLRQEAVSKFGTASEAGVVPELFVAGQRLQGIDGAALREFRQLHNGCAVQVLLRSTDVEAERLQRQREDIARERESLRREREELRRCREQQAGDGNLPETARPPAPLVAGVRVTLQGLRATPELNGRQGTVRRYDAASSRYIVDVDGPGGGEKSFSPQSLLPCRAASTSFVGKACAKLQVWVSAYAWWQLMLGVLIVLLVAYWLVVSPSWRGSSSSRSHSQRGTRRQGSGGARADTRQQDERRYQESSRRQDDQSYSYDYYSGGGGGGGLLSGLDQTSLLLIIGAFGFLCWKDIIPVRNMDFFQIYMLWSLVQPWLFGGRRRGGGGGFGFSPMMFARRGLF